MDVFHKLFQKQIIAKNNSNNKWQIIIVVLVTLHVQEFKNLYHSEKLWIHILPANFCSALVLSFTVASSCESLIYKMKLQPQNSYHLLGN